MLKKKIWANFQRNIELFTKNFFKKLLKIWSCDRDPGSEIRDPEKTYSGSRIRIRNTVRYRIYPYLLSFCMCTFDVIQNFKPQSKEKCSQNLVWMYSKLNCTRNANLFLIFRRMKEKADTENEVVCLPLPSRSQGCIAIFPKVQMLPCANCRLYLWRNKETSAESSLYSCYGYNRGPPVGGGGGWLYPPFSHPTISHNLFWV